jgi:hypothetical protein
MRRERSVIHDNEQINMCCAAVVFDESGVSSDQAALKTSNAFLNEDSVASMSGVTKPIHVLLKGQDLQDFPLRPLGSHGYGLNNQISL